MDRSLFLSLIQNLLQVNVFFAELKEDSAPLRSFQDNHCFHTALQPMFTAQALALLAASMREHTFYEIVDTLGVCLFFFLAQGQVCFLGPYVKEPFDEKKQQGVLAENGLPASHALSLKLYYTAFPLHSTYHIQRTVEACLAAFFPMLPAFAYRRLEGFHEKIVPETQYDPKIIDYSAIYRRYDVENHFLAMVQSGDVEQVMTAFSEMQRSASTGGQAFLAESYKNPLIPLSIMRALVRKAAEQGGLSVVTIDEITQKNSQLISASRDLREQTRYTYDMILELTQRVREARQRLGAYSAPIARAVEYLSFHFSQKLSMQELSRQASLSPSVLSRRFKAETGRTVGQYLARLRCEKAAKMLLDTSWTIQEISAYVGYPDNNYFVKVFRGQYGTTPSEWRRAKGAHQEG